MKSTNAKITAGFLLLGALISTTALANPVVMRVGLDANGGQIGALQQFMSRANQVAAVVSPNGTGNPVLLANTFHGTNFPGGASVAITFASLEDWAAVTAKQRTSPEWQQLLQTFPADSYTVSFQGLSEMVWQMDGATQPSPGNVLVIYGFDILQGGLQPMMSFLDRVSAVSEREGLAGQPTLMVPIAAGPSNGQTATVVVRFNSAAEWAETLEKQNASRAWQEAFASFPADNYRLTNQGMSTVVAIP